jgi:NTP pyrophosphatase (non-canonical NTP hydrolase)
LHSELSEALEEYRSGREKRYYEDHDGDETVYLSVPFGASYPQGKKPIGVPSEMADVLIRLLDVCERYDINLYREFRAKLEYNKTRGHRHGGKVI